MNKNKQHEFLEFKKLDLSSMYTSSESTENGTAKKEYAPPAPPIGDLQDIVDAVRAGKYASMYRHEPSKGRETALSFPSCNVPAGATHMIVSRPQVTFRPFRLVVAPSCAPHFWMCDLRIGKCSQFTSADRISCEMFPPLPFGLSPEDHRLWERLCSHPMDTAQVGQDVTMFVLNRTGQSKDFDATLWGVGLFP
jgi:hypothetical protein